MIRKFDQYLKVNETYERYVFRTRLQHEGESILHVTDLKHKSKRCNYGILEESLIRDQIVLGTLNLKVKGKILSNDDLDLEKAVFICQASEVAKPQIQAMTDGTSSRTMTASDGAVRRSGKNKCYHGNQKIHSGQGSEVRSNRENRIGKQKYRHCGRKHSYNECPAW